MQSSRGLVRRLSVTCTRDVTTKTVSCPRVTRCCLVGVAQDNNPESVEAEKLGVGAFESRPGCSFCAEARALLCLTWADPVAGNDVVNMSTCCLTGQTAGKSANLEPPCSTAAARTEQCCVGVHSGNYAVVQGGQRLLRAGGDFLGVRVWGGRCSFDQSDGCKRWPESTDPEG